MSVCRKHRRERRTSCSCRTSSTVAGNGYGGPDVSDLAVSVFEALVRDDSSSYSSYDSGSSSSSSYDSGPSSSYDSGSGSSYDSGSSSYDSGSSSW